MSDYLRLERPPALQHPGNPRCDACEVEVSYEYEEWLCPSCGTAWPADNMEADSSDATMYQDWSGEELTGPVCRNEFAWRASGLPGWAERFPEAVAERGEP